MSTLTCSCGVALNVGGIAAGKSVRCPKCQQVLTVPGAAPAVVTASAVASPGSSGAVAEQKQKLKCPCGQILGVKASMAGKQVKCPYCQKLLQVPGAPAAQAVPRPAAAPASPTGFPSQGGRMFDNVPGPQPMASAAPFGNMPASGAAAPAGAGGYYNSPGMPMPASGAAMGGRAPRSRGGGGISPGVVIIVGLVVCVVASLLSFILPKLGLILGSLIFIGASCLSPVGSIWMLIVAFEDDTTEGLLVLFVPFYFFYYLIKTWDGSVPYIINALTFALLGLAISVFAAGCLGALVFAPN